MIRWVFERLLTLCMLPVFLLGSLWYVVKRAFSYGYDRAELFFWSEK